MAVLKVLFRYPANIFYARSELGPPHKYEISSILCSNGEDIDLYREIIRVSDGALQILKFNQNENRNLYSDQACKNITNIAIGHDWILKQPICDSKIPSSNPS